MDETTTATLDGTLEESVTATVTAAAPEAELVENELLVEEISIDGMCGVY